MNELFTQRLQHAVERHHVGDIAEANTLYRALHEEDPQRLDVMHNLGATSLGLGRFREGVSLMSQAIAADPANPGMRDSPKLLGTELFRAGYWEEAYPWLLEALQLDPDDVELHGALNRVAPRDYLKPEQYDPQSKETLKRYSPREADNYIYTIDIVGNCNLRCPSCPVGNSRDEQRFKKMMPLDVFESILAKIKRESPCANPQIWLYNWGEPLLHPKLPSILELIHSAGYRSYLSSNLNIEKGLREVIKAAPTELKVSISGFSTQTYEVSHTGGNINLVKSNLYRLRQYLDQYQNETRIWVGQHVYRHNHHEVEEVAVLCKEMGFEHHPIQAFYQPLEKLIDLAQGDDVVENEAIMQEFLISPKQQIEFSKAHKQSEYDCELRFNQTVINADASVALCCSQYRAEHFLGTSFLEASHSELEQRKHNNPLCKSCRECGLDYAPKSLPDSIHSEPGE